MRVLTIVTCGSPHGYELCRKDKVMIPPPATYSDWKTWADEILHRRGLKGLVAEATPLLTVPRAK